MPEVKKFSPNKPEKLLKRIKDCFPHLNWSAYDYIDEGWDHEVLILDSKLVFRFPNDEEYLKLLKDEIIVLKQLRPLVSVTIPDYQYVAPDSSFAGYPIITGTPLLKEKFDALSPADRESSARQLAAFLSTAHTFIKNGYDLGTQVPAYMEGDQEQTKHQAREYLRPVLSSKDFETVQEILNDVDTLLELPLPSVFLHGDVYHSHLLWDTSTKQLGVIDFSDMSVGDPAIDFAELYEYGKGYVQEVYNYYTGPKDETFLERAWKYQRWVGVYMMSDHFVYHKTSFDEARETFDRVKIDLS